RFLEQALPDDDALRSALTTVAVACLFAIIAPIYALLVFLIEHPPAPYYWLAAMAFATALATLVLLRRGLYRFASYFVLTGGTACVTISYLLEGSRGQ